VQGKLVGAQAGLGLEPPQLGLELGEIVEAAVHGGEPDRGHPVDPDEAAQGELADALGAERPARPADLLRDFVRDSLELLDPHRPFGGGAEETSQQLVAVKRLGSPVALHDRERDPFGALVGGEARSTGLALTPAADDVARLREPGVDDARRGV